MGINIHEKENRKTLKEKKMLILQILSFIVLLGLAYLSILILGVLAKIAGDISSIQDYCSKEHAKVVAEDMKKKGYVITEAGKELLKANTGK
jgi:hypothetical protein